MARNFDWVNYAFGEGRLQNQALMGMSGGTFSSGNRALGGGDIVAAPF
jgi:hypothetical protein